MKKLITAVIFAALCVATFAQQQHLHNKVVCYWNATSFERQGPAKFQVDDLRPALSYCTHLVYGYAGIKADTHEVTALHPRRDTEGDKAFFRVVPKLKDNFPGLKVYLSIGGNDDPYEDTHKYLIATETSVQREKFVASIEHLLTNYQFDGVDLAWQFPTVKVKKDRGIFGSIAHGIKKTFGYGKFKDEKEVEHRDGFTILVRDLKNRLRPKNNKDVTLTVLPHVNVTAYYDVRSLGPNIDAVHIFAFDQKSPERTPKEADYTAPIYSSYGRAPQENIDAGVKYWLDNGIPGEKVIVGIPTYARTWKLTPESQPSAVPPVSVDGPGAAGPQTQTPGLLSYAEVCTGLSNTAGQRLTRVNDPSKKYGSCAWRIHDGTDGIWMSFEEPETAGIKASYAKAKGLGGVAIVDISLDDFRGTCNGDQFPILKAAKSKL